MKIEDFFTDEDLLYIAVSEKGRFCYLYAEIKDVVGNDEEVITKETVMEYLDRNNINILSLPHIEDASPALRYLYKAVMESDYSMYFVEQPEEDGNCEWEEIGLTMEQFIEQVQADVKKYHLEDEVVYKEDMAIFTCYGGLQSRFTTLNI